MKSLIVLKAEIDALLPREQQELLHYIAKRVTAVRSLESTDGLPLVGCWAEEENSEAQFLIPELEYRSPNLGREDEKKPDIEKKSEDDLL